MADDVSREDLKAKRDRLAELRAANAEKQREQAEDLTKQTLKADADRLDQDIAYEEWAASILNGEAAPPVNEEREVSSPPNNTSLRTPVQRTATPDSDDNKDGA